MKIAHLVASLDSRHGGPSRSVRGLAQAQIRLGNQVEILTTSDTVERECVLEGALTIQTFRRVWPERIARSPALAAYLNTQQFDVIHAHGLWLRVLHYAHRYARNRNVPLVLSPRGMMTPWAWNHHRHRKHIAALLLHPTAMRSVMGWHVTSEDEARNVTELGFTQPICIAPNGVNLPTPKETADALAFWEPRVRSGTPERVALFYSRFHSKKRILELIALWGSAERVGWKLLVVGIPDEFSVTELQTLVERQPPSARIQVEDGTHAPPPYEVADLVLLPSHSENFGLVVAEGMANYLPVLATDGSPWQSLEAHNAGWCVSWEEFPSLLDSVLKLPSANLVAKGRNGRTWIVEAFSWIHSAKTVNDFYVEITPHVK